MSAQLFSLASEPLKPEDLIQAVGASICTAPLAIGAIASFLGLVRGENLGRRVIRLEYESYEPLAIKAFERIAMEAREHWPKSQLALHHRLCNRGFFGPSCRIVRGVPIYHRTCQTNCTHLET